MNKKLLFIPIFNCEKQIVRLCYKFFNSTNKNFFDEIVFVDNRSVDKTVKNIINFFKKKKCRSKIKIFRNTENYNLGGSHKLMLNYAINHKYEYLFVCQGDDQGNINDLVNGFKKSKNKKQTKLASRFLKKSKIIGYNKLKIIGNLFFNLIFKLFTMKKVSDLGCGQIIYYIRDFKKKDYLRFPNGLYFTYYMTMYILLYLNRYSYIPIKWEEYDQISNLKIIKQIKELFKLLIKVIFYKKNFFYKMKKNTKKLSSKIIFEF